jgi:hypothetical protein
VKGENCGLRPPGASPGGRSKAFVRDGATDTP